MGNTVWVALLVEENSYDSYDVEERSLIGVFSSIEEWRKAQAKIVPMPAKIELVETELNGIIDYAVNLKSPELLEAEKFLKENGCEFMYPRRDLLSIKTGIGFPDISLARGVIRSVKTSYESIVYEAAEQLKNLIKGR